MHISNMFRGMVVLLLFSCVCTSARAVPPVLAAPPAASSKQPFRVNLTANIPAILDSGAARLDVRVDETTGAVTPLWAGVAGSGKLPQAWDKIAPYLNASDASLVRVRLNDLVKITLSATGEAIPPDFTQADAQLSAMRAQKLNSIIEVTPAANGGAEAWTETVAEAMQRYRDAEKYGVARWEFAGTAAEAGEWLERFTERAQKFVPERPVGFRLTAGDPVQAAETLAALSRKTRLTLNSFAWEMTENPMQARRMIAQIRAAFAREPGLKRALLFPILTEKRSEGNFAAARLVALAAALKEAAPSHQPNGILGVLSILSETMQEDGQPTQAGRALALLNRITGTRLNVHAAGAGIGCLAARSAGRIVLLCWREEEQGAAKEQLAYLRLHGLSAGGGYRMERYIASPQTDGAESEEKTGRMNPDVARVHEEPDAVADLPGGKTDLELPIVLSPGEVTLIELKPRRAPGLELSLSASNWNVTSGNMLELNATVRNISQTPQKADLFLPGSGGGFVPVEGLRATVGMLAPGKARAFRFQLRVPPVRADRQAFLNMTAGEDIRASLAARLRSPLTAMLETPLIDLEKPEAQGTAKVILSNRTHAPLTVTLRLSGSPQRTAEKVSLPADGTPITKNVALPTPSVEPGSYPVAIAVEGPEGPLATLRPLVAVPMLCRYATLKPNIDGDLREWTDAEPIGMGREEQIHEKKWRGPNDLSAYAFTRWDEQFFYFACAVTDDVFFAPYSAGEMGRGDSILFALSFDREHKTDRRDFGAGDHAFGIALLNAEKPTLYRFAGPAGTEQGIMKRGVIAIRRVGTRTYYEAAIPWTELVERPPKAGAGFGFSVVVNDNDGQGAGYMEWGSGLARAKHPIQFPLLRLVR